MSEPRTTTTCERPLPIAVTSTRLPLTALLALATTAALILVTELLPVGLLPQMGAALHVSEGKVGFLAAAYAAAATVAAIPLTALTRDLPRRPLLVGLVAGFGVVDLATAASSSYPVTLTVRVVAGLLGGLVWSMLAGYAARLVPEKQRGRAIAIALSGITVALAVGVPAGTALAGWLGWRVAFLALAAIAAGLVGWISWQVPAVGGDTRGQRASYGALLRRPGVGAVLGVTLLLLLGHQMTYTFLQPLAQAAGVASIGPVLLVFGLGAVGGIWLIGAVVDRHLRPAAVASVGLVALALLGLAASTGLASSMAGLVVVVAVWGLAFGGAPTILLAALIRSAGAANANAANSLQATVYNVGVAGGSFAGGLAIDRLGVGAVPWLAVPLVTAALVLVVSARATFASRA